MSYVRLQELQTSKNIPVLYWPLLMTWRLGEVQLKMKRVDRKVAILERLRCAEDVLVRSGKERLQESCLLLSSGDTERTFWYVMKRENAWRLSVVATCPGVSLRQVTTGDKLPLNSTSQLITMDSDLETTYPASVTLLEHVGSAAAISMLCVVRQYYHTRSTTAIGY